MNFNAPSENDFEKLIMSFLDWASSFELRLNLWDFKKPIAPELNEAANSLVSSVDVGVTDSAWAFRDRASIVNFIFFPFILYNVR